MRLVYHQSLFKPSPTRGSHPGTLSVAWVVSKAIPLQYGRDFTVSINLRNSFFLANDSQEHTVGE